MEENKPIKIGAVELPDSGLVPVYSVWEGQVSAISFKSLNEDPNEGKTIYWNHQTGEMTYEDGSPHVSFKSAYVAGFVTTQCKTIEEFKEKELEIVCNHVKEKLQIINKDGRS